MRETGNFVFPDLNVSPGSTSENTEISGNKYHWSVHQGLVNNYSPKWR